MNLNKKSKFVLTPESRRFGSFSVCGGLQYGLFLVKYAIVGKVCPCGMFSKEKR